MTIKYSDLSLPLKIIIGLATALIIIYSIILIVAISIGDATPEEYCEQICLEDNAQDYDYIDQTCYCWNNNNELINAYDIS